MSGRKLCTVTIGLLLLVACGPKMSFQIMANQPRYEPYEPSTFFGDGTSARMPIEGTVSRGTMRDETLLFIGQVDGAPADVFPFPITMEIVQRGQERFDIFCAPCHDRTGSGNGMIVQRGFQNPPSFHSDRLRQAPAGHFFDVISNGFGPMPSYATQVPVHDRWAIIAYIRALQLSQHATVNDVPAQERESLETSSQ